MVWEVDKCKSDGRILLRRNTQISNGIIHQFLGFAPSGKPTPTLIHPEEMGEIIVEKVGFTFTFLFHLFGDMQFKEG